MIDPLIFKNEEKGWTILHVLFPWVVLVDLEIDNYYFDCYVYEAGIAVCYLFSLKTFIEV